MELQPLVLCESNFNLLELPGRGGGRQREILRAVYSVRRCCVECNVAQTLFDKKPRRFNCAVIEYELYFLGISTCFHVSYACYRIITRGNKKHAKTVALSVEKMEYNHISMRGFVILDSEPDPSKRMNFRNVDGFVVARFPVVLRTVATAPLLLPLQTATGSVISIAKSEQNPSVSVPG